jgi:hypothetical protein
MSGRASGESDPSRPRLHGQYRDRNIQAVQAFAGLMGGYAGLAKEGLSLRSLLPILDSDPGDDLSGLRTLAERMTPSWTRANTPISEPEMAPHIATHWLLSTGGPNSWMATFY